MNNKVFYFFIESTLIQTYLKYYRLQASCVHSKLVLKDPFQVGRPEVACYRLHDYSKTSTKPQGSIWEELQVLRMVSGGPLSHLGFCLTCSLRKWTLWTTLVLQVWWDHEIAALAFLLVMEAVYSDWSFEQHRFQYIEGWTQVRFNRAISATSGLHALRLSSKHTRFPCRN